MLPGIPRPRADQKAIALWHKAGFSVTQYWSTYFFSNHSEVYQRHWKEWAHTLTNGKLWLPPTGPQPNGNSGLTTCCPRIVSAISWSGAQDYLMRNYDLDGLDTSTAPDRFTAATRGTAAGAEPMPSSPTARCSNVGTRSSEVQAERLPLGARQRELRHPLLAFMDAYIGGEEFRPTVHPLKDLDRTRLAVTMTGRQWGSQPMWMYQCTCNLQEH